MLQRRRFLTRSLLSLGSLSVPSLSLAQAAATKLSTTELVDGLVLIQGAGENIVACARDNQLLLVDGGEAQYADSVLELLRQTFATDRVETLINTHWHPEQTGLNQVLGARGTNIVAHENTRLWLSTETIVRWQDTIYPPLAEQAQPNTTFHGKHSLKFDGEDIECGYLLQGHTDGDIFVKFHERNVLVVGGVLASDTWPLIDWSTAGWIGGMVLALDALLDECDDETLIVPASGHPIHRDELATQAVMYREIMAKLKVMMESGFGTAEVLAEKPTEGYKPDWGSPDLFLTLAFRSFWGHVRQFDVV